MLAKVLYIRHESHIVICIVKGDYVHIQ